MKRIFLSAPIIALAASCSKNETFDVNNASNEINFTNLNHKPTRAANDDGDNYRVFAQYTTATANWYIGADNTENIYTSADLNTASKEYYWPSVATLDFYAYAPADLTGVTTTPPTATTKGSLSIAYTVPTAANEDFTVATPIENQNGEDVDLEFNHMLAKVLFEVRLHTDVAAEFEFAETNAPTMTLGVKRNSGTVAINENAPVFTVGGSDATYSYTGILTTEELGSVVDGNYEVSYNIAPQAYAGTTIDISGIVINKKGGAQHYAGALSTFTLAEGQIQAEGNQKGDTDFEQGNAYKFIIEIGFGSEGPGPGPDPIFEVINFSSVVIDWKDVEVNL